MSPPNTRARCPLHLLLVGRDGGDPDPAGLLAVLGDRAGPASVVIWTPADDGPDAPTLLRAADLLDDVERLTGARPRYREAGGDLAGVVAALTATDPSASGGSIIAVSARAPRRVVRAQRRSVSTTGNHLALLPPRSALSHRSVIT